MFLTGIADEAGQDLSLQIKATQALGWNAIEARNIDGCNIHDISDEAFDQAVEQLAAASIKVCCFGSTIANWAKQITDPFEQTLEEVERAIPRMQRLGTTMVRVMSYARRDDADQMADERFSRLREIYRRFNGAGMTVLHENCMNYGGMSAQHTIELLEQVPGIKLVFDTANPVFNRDESKADRPWQNALDFYTQVRDHIAHVHIKDAMNPKEGEKEVYTWPGEGQGYVKEILTDLKVNDYQGGISIEPHLAAVFHDPSAVNTASDKSYDLYVEYGQRMMALLESIGYAWQPYENV